MYRINSDGSVITEEVPVERDEEGNIVSIAGVNIDDLQGLLSFFETLEL